MLPEIEYFASVLRKVGVNPRRNRPSLEKLVNSMLKRGDLPAINTLVDAYKSSSLAAIRVLAYNFAKGRESRLSRSSATRRNCV